MPNKNVFHDTYFKEYYSAFTGSFSHQDLERNKRWFTGWFDALQDLFDFKAGNGRKVLEIGCSIGAAAAILEERGFNVLATDFSEYAVKHAKKLLPNIDFQELDIEESTQFKSKFDLIFGFEVIEHLPQHEKAIGNMKRMLKPGGVVICSTPRPYAHIYRDVTHVNVRHPKDWQRIFTAAGFRNVKTKDVTFIPFFYKFSPKLHFRLPFPIPTRYLNSTVFIYAQK